MANPSKQTKGSVGTKPQVTPQLKVEFTAVEVNSVLEFMLSQPMKIARNYTPVIQFLEGKLKEVLDKVEQPQISKQNGDSNP